MEIKMNYKKFKNQFGNKPGKWLAYKYKKKKVLKL